MLELDQLQTLGVHPLTDQSKVEIDDDVIDFMALGQ